MVSTSNGGLLRDEWISTKGSTGGRDEVTGLKRMGLLTRGVHQCKEAEEDAEAEKAALL